MTVIQAEFPALLAAAVAAHANVIQLRVEGAEAVLETLAAGSVVISRRLDLAECAQLLPAIFALCDEDNDYQYGASRTARMSGARTALPVELSMVFIQFFPARDGGRHLVARLTYQGDMCCGTCGG